MVCLRSGASGRVASRLMARFRRCHFLDHFARVESGVVSSGSRKRETYKQRQARGKSRSSRNRSRCRDPKKGTTTPTEARIVALFRRSALVTTYSIRNHWQVASDNASIGGAWNDPRSQFSEASGTKSQKVRPASSFSTRRVIISNIKNNC